MSSDATHTDAIQEAQDALTKKVEIAKLGEDRQLASVVRERGEQMARLMAGVFRLTRVHDLKNDAFKQPVNDLTGHITELQDLLGSIHMIVVEDQIYVNDIRIRFDIHSEVPRDLNTMWSRHRIGGVSIHGPVTADQLKTFVDKVSTASPAPRGARQVLQNWCTEAGLAQIELQPIFRFRLQGEGEKVKAVNKDVAEIYARNNTIIGDVWDNMAAGRSPNTLPVRRLVTDLLDMDEQEQVDEMLEVVNDHHTPAHMRHSMQVAALAVLIGREIGMDGPALSDLGVAATFHDIGYTTEEDGYPPPFERHGTAGARLLLAQRGFHEARIRRLLACLQHHRSHDDLNRPALYARIIKIADDYDTLTRWRRGGPMMSPPEALEAMHAGCWTLYDPTLFQAFVNRLGKYPPGTLLEMSKGTWVMVISGVRGPETFAKPLAVVVRLKDGRRPSKRIVVDLAERGTIKGPLPYDLDED